MRDRTLYAWSAALFVASAAVTIAWCASMSGGMPMPGGWTMSMVWMRMPGQTWLGATGSFMTMWVVMMAAMMLPSLVPILAGYRRAVRALAVSRLGGLTTLVGAGYFLVWALVGAAVYPVGVVLGAAEMRWQVLSRAVPIASGAVLLAAGSVQLTAWKARALACCRMVPRSPPADARGAWRLGIRLGTDCCRCSVAYMMVLLIAGLMDLAAMAVVTVAITVERLAPKQEHVARTAGVALVTALALGAA